MAELEIDLSNKELAILINKTLQYLSSERGLTAKEVVSLLNVRGKQLSESMMSTLRNKQQTQTKGNQGGHYFNLRRQIKQMLLDEFELVYHISTNELPGEPKGDVDFEISSRTSISSVDKKAGSHFVCYTWKSGVDGGLSVSMLSLFPDRPREKAPRVGSAELFALDEAGVHGVKQADNIYQLGSGTFEVKEKMLYVELGGTSKDAIYRNFLVVQLGTNSLISPTDRFFFGTFSGIRRHGAPSSGAIVVRYHGSSAQEAKEFVEKKLVDQIQNEERQFLTYFLNGKRITMDHSPSKQIIKSHLWEKYQALNRDHADLYCGFYVNAVDGNLQRCLLDIGKDGTGVLVTTSNRYDGFFKLLARNEVLVGGFDRDDDDLYRFRVNLLANFPDDPYLRGTYSGTEATVAKPNGGRIIFVKVLHIYECLSNPSDADKLVSELVKKADARSLNQAFEKLQNLPAFCPADFLHSAPRRLEDNIPGSIFTEVKSFLLGKKDFYKEAASDFDPKSQEFFGESPEYFRRIGWITRTPENNSRDSISNYVGVYYCYTELFHQPGVVARHPIVVSDSGEVRIKIKDGETVSGYAVHQDGRRLTFIFEDDRWETVFSSFIVNRLPHQEINLAYGVVTRQEFNSAIVSSLGVLQATKEYFDAVDYKEYDRTTTGDLYLSETGLDSISSIVDYLVDFRTKRHLKVSNEPNSEPFDYGIVSLLAAVQQAKMNPSSGRWRTLLIQALKSESFDADLLDSYISERGELYPVADKVRAILDDGFEVLRTVHLKKR